MRNIQTGLQEAGKSLAELQISLKQIKQIREGKIKKQRAKDFLNDQEVISTPAKAQLLEQIKEAVENLNLVKQGKPKASPAKDLLDEI